MDFKVTQMSDKRKKELAEQLAKALTDGIKEAAAKYGIAVQTDCVGTMFGFFFNENPVSSFADALTSDTILFGRFHSEMLKRGVYLAPSQFEAGFICSVMNYDTVAFTLDAAKDSFAAIKG